MDDPELARIREQRMKQLQAQYGQGVCYFIFFFTTFHSGRLT